MRVSLFLAVFLVLAVATGKGQDHGLTTTRLADECRYIDYKAEDPVAVPKVVWKVECISFFEGYTIGFYTGSLNHPNPIFCLPKDYSPYEGAKVFMKYVEDNPTALHEVVSVVLAKAFQAAYRCKANQ